MIDNTESLTAKICAFARGWHSYFAKEKIFDDHLAYDLMGKENFDSIREYITDEFTDGTREDFVNFLDTYFTPIPISRIKFTEERILRFAGDEQVQYVICGAGEDTFSFRNEHENIDIFEIDHPDTQRYKLDRIRELEWNIPKNVHFVPVDFEKEDMVEKLLSAGFDIRKKTFFSILGVSYYLSLPVFTETLSNIAELSIPDSVLVFDFPLKGDNFPERVSRLEQITADMGEEMPGGFRYEDISRALYSLGFQIDTYLSPKQVDKAYFAGRKDNMKAFENVSLLSAIYTGGYVFE